MVSDEQLMGNMNNTSRNSSYCCLCLKSKVRRRRGEKNTVWWAEFQSAQLSLYGCRARSVQVGSGSLAGCRSDLEQAPAPLPRSC